MPGKPAEQWEIAGIDLSNQYFRLRKYTAHPYR